MKLLIASDIHGSEYYAKKLEQIYKEENPNYIVLLGDLLYHGARNKLPKGYNPQGVIEVLNKYKDRILSVKGNCDSEVDQMVLDFDIDSPYSNILIDRIRMFITHGHLYNKDKMPNVPIGTVIISGHTHVPIAEKYRGYFFINPGSTTLPKKDSKNSYAIYHNRTFEIRDFDGNVIKSLEIDI